LEPRDEPEPTPSETRPPSENEREYVVLTPSSLLEEQGVGGYKIVKRGVFTSRQGALEFASKDFDYPELEKGVSLIAVPASYFKPVTVKVETVRQVKWEDG
jgi:hypothetical protein